VTLQATLNTNGAANFLPVHYAILEWTGVSDTAISDVVRDWTSVSYTANNFFLSSSITVAAVGSTTVTFGATTNITLPATISSSCNNLIVFFWTSSAVVQYGGLILSKVDCHTGTSRVWDQRPAAQELSLCQRYFEKSYPIDIKPGTSTMSGISQGWVIPTSYGWMRTPQVTSFVVSKRTIPVVTIYSPTTGTAAKVGEYDAGSTYVADRDVIVMYTSHGSFSIQRGWNTTAWGDGAYIWNHWAADAEL
jgi:hypothetical protein